MGGHVASQTAASGESGVAHQALVGLQARVGPDMSFEDARRGKAPAALHTLERPFSCVGPGGAGESTHAVTPPPPYHPYLTCCFRWLDFL